MDAVDLAEALLVRGRTVAAAAGLDHLRFVRADVTQYGERATYDLMQCVLGVFLLPDMDAGTAHLVSLARPGGRVVVTCWGEGAIEPVRATVGEVLPEERPELAAALSTPSPADRIQTPDALTAWLGGLDVADVAVTRVPLQVPLDAAVVRSLFEGTALRALLDGLDPGRYKHVLARITDAALRRGASMDAITLVAVGTAP